MHSYEIKVQKRMKNSCKNEKFIILYFHCWTRKKVNKSERKDYKYARRAGRGINSEGIQYNNATIR